MTESSVSQPSGEQEMWTVIQVATHLGVNYQKARNNMLAGDYGPASYDAHSRRLTVRADCVRAAKSKRGRKPAKVRRDRS